MRQEGKRKMILKKEEEERQVKIRTNKRWIESTQIQILGYKERYEERIEELSMHLLEYKENIKMLGGKADQEEKQKDAPLELSLEEISEFRTRLMLDRLEIQLLMHYIRIPIETLKRRYDLTTSDKGRLLIKTAIEYKEEKVMRNDN